MGDRSPAGAAIPERAGQRARSVSDWSQAGYRLSARLQGRRAPGAVRELTSEQPMDITAAVVHEKFGAFAIERLELCDPRPDEVLVKIAASGMAQTDLHGRDGYFDSPYPAVYGHEGAGVVQAVGSGVSALAPGDHVVISFPWCGACPNCRRNMPFHCMNGRALKSRGTRPDGSTLMSKSVAPVYSAFFQQSSFASHAIPNDRSPHTVTNAPPLQSLGPLASTS